MKEAKNLSTRVRGVEWSFVPLVDGNLLVPIKDHPTCTAVCGWRSPERRGARAEAEGVTLRVADEYDATTGYFGVFGAAAARAGTHSTFLVL